MAIQWFTTSEDVCGCEADVTQVSTVIAARRGPMHGFGDRGMRAIVRSRQVRHWRARDDAHFWHWEDSASDLVDIPYMTE